jgi:hypothetical protein
MSIRKNCRRAFLDRTLCLGIIMSLVASWKDSSVWFQQVFQESTTHDATSGHGCEQIV